MEVKSRHHLRSDAIDDICAHLKEHFGIDLTGDAFEQVEFEDDDTMLVLIDGEPLVFFVEEEAAPTVRGANAFPPTKRVVTVDAGAVSFVSDGADVMRPGIVDADGTIEANDLVVIEEETHGKALAIGRARVAGDDLTGDSGKVVDTIHHVSDDLYAFTP